MKATAELRAEHEGVLRMLSILERVVEKIQQGLPVPMEHPGQIIEFLQVFVDSCHHGKEEDVLFPALEAAGVPHDGPIGVMLLEHELGRGHVRAMAQALASGDQQAFLAPASAYSDLLRAHIFKENNVLFRMADRALSEAEQEGLWERFERIEQERIGAGRHEAFHALLDALENAHPRP